KNNNELNSETKIMTNNSAISAIKTTLILIAATATTMGNNTFATDASKQSVAVAQKAPVHHGQGTLNHIKNERIVDITHGPIEPLGMPGMRMNFKVAKGVDLSAFNAGDKVDFNVIEGDAGWYVIIKMKKI
ncbi:MAG: copper-binding protein, partial [Kordiimonas sp.]